MKLYHGTSIDNAKRIIKEGFKDRLVSKKNNWKGKFRSHSGFIYLTRAYPFYYGMNTAKSKDKLASVLLVEVDEKDLYPDDDFLRQVLKTNDDRIDLEKYKEYGLLSLENIGNVSIKPGKIKKVIGYKDFDITKMWRYSDPSMHIMNYKILGGYYRRLTDEWWNDGNWENITISNYTMKGGE